MHTPLHILSLTALLALTTAIPYPQDDPDGIFTIPIVIPTATITATPITTTDEPDDTITEAPVPAPTRSKNPHWEPIPVFSKQCTCELATARYPCWATDALQAVGGCPTPTRICSTLYSPTPRPGPHPCELGPNPPPLITELPVTLSVNITVPTVNVPVPVVPVVTVV
ncbi:hypothetical protein T440DRAFT_510915 [Plenodomus tracheiphilus IPT5]|uniref:Extracellular membrane protein CFEM domain-containing protein n=1 Tax=Plenodomus tracheiphilus IPT5 TaxID=1408161 RepID=A0A6A7ASY8_9PLEO|nr:hypothetical protein T440DRAFT_510915 [Plenodomus tracheiphilus IPT5]